MRRLLTPRWLLVHTTTIVLVVVFLRLGWWQVNRAEAGNTLSYGYAFQWPAFAVFVVYVWFKEVRSALRDGSRPFTVPRVEKPAPQPHEGPAYDDSDDEQLAAYNRYLAWLNAHPHASPRDYPG